MMRGRTSYPITGPRRSRWAILLAVGWIVAGVAGESAPPNVVLIMADDMGFSDLGCYGGEIDTPHLDALARQGLRFTQFYNNAKCTTTRASILTGLYPRQGGRGQHLLTPQMVTLGEALRDIGYQTCLSGKWHLGARAPHRPIDRGFDEFYGLLDGCCNFFRPTQPDPPFKGGRTRVFAHNAQRIHEFPDDFYTTDAFTDHAIQTMERFAAHEAPFLLHICYTAPHYPLHAKPVDIAKYRGRYRLGWDALRQQRHQRQLEMGLIDAGWRLPPRDPEAEAWSEAPHQAWQALRMEVYAAMIDCMDQNIGRVLSALKRLGLEDQTIVLFLSDNGGCAERPGGDNPAAIPGPREHYTHCGPGWAYAQNTPFRRYKQWVHEGGIATPLIVRWPATIEAGSITNQVGHIIDLLPTFLEMAGSSYPAERNGQSLIACEGRSLLPVFQGHQREPHQGLYWEWGGNRAVRQGDWKLCWDRTQKTWELYNLVADRTELEDLAQVHPTRVTAMAADWEAWARRNGHRR